MGPANPAALLVASELAYAEVCNAWVSFRNRTLSWWIVAVNMLGSIAFGVSAIASTIQPSTDEPVSAAISNAGTAFGGICFLIGAVLLLPEAAKALAQRFDAAAERQEIGRLPLHGT